MKYYRVNEGSENAMRLQGMGFVKGTKAENIKVGDTLMWNFGSKSVVSAILSETKSSIVIQETVNEKSYERRLMKKRLVCILE